MKAFLATCFLLLLALQAKADDFDSELVESEGRFLFFNTSSTASSLTLLGALILLGVIAYLVYAGGLLGNAGFKRNDYYEHDYGQYQDPQYAQFRSNDANGFDSLNIIQWIGTLQDMYENFDYNDMECQKRQICEFVKEPELFGATAKKFKNGLQYAKYFEKFMPGEMQFILDEYMQANDKGLDNKDCEEFFPCEFSLKDSYRKTFTGNGL